MSTAAYFAPLCEIKFARMQLAQVNLRREKCQNQNVKMSIANIEMTAEKMGAIGKRNKMDAGILIRVLFVDSKKSK